MLVVVFFGVHRSSGLTRGYWRSTDAPIQTSTVLSEASRDVSSVTQVTRNKDVIGKQPVPDGVDGGLIRPWPARQRGQSVRGSSGHFHDHYPDFPRTTSTTSQPKRQGSNKNIYKLVK